MFKRKTNYGYYSGYGSSRRRGPNSIVIISIVAVIVVIGVLVFFNFSRIQLMIKGYSWSQTSAILTLPSEDANLVKEEEVITNIEEWIALSKTAKNYQEYNTYAATYSEKTKEEVVAYIDGIYQNQVPTLTSLGYSEDEIWQMILVADEAGLQYLIDNSLTSGQTKPYREVEGYKLENMLAYMEQYKITNDYTYSVVYTNYPFILSTTEPTTEYQITNPDDVTNLVKPGFTLASDYVPSDLVIPNVPIAPSAEDNQVRQVAATALEEMVAAALEDDMHLVLNSAYRSYDRQLQTYNDFEAMYGGQYAAEYVAQPGASEHQTGLGIDLTSQSVLDGERLVFGDTEEYQWVLKNAHKYGYLVRFQDDKADITGIAHEPWHLRYLGVDLATKVYESGLTYEEYCLKNNILPELEVK